jgi:hypothetical protein
MSSTSGTIPMQIATQKSDVIAEYTALSDGLKTDLTDVDTITLDGVDYKRVALIAKFDGRVAAAQKTKAQRAVLSQCVADEKANDKEVRPLRNALKGYLKTRFGKDSPRLQKYGFTPDKPPRKRASVKAAAVEKAQATRKQRGIMGRKQRTEIKAPAAAPVAAPPPAPAPAPAPAARPSTPNPGSAS